ncbi:TOBE domain-containing protein, partial [Klebsiella pneumoniae]|uniref:TOBE domain-containing protein n=1 Tax=Klebsiella pneumoniae TaxID=573 RepID=UPI003EE1DC35
FLADEEAWLTEQPGLAALLKRMSMKTSARNQLHGRIATVNPGPATTTVRVTVDGGQQITAALTTPAAEELQLQA